MPGGGGVLRHLWPHHCGCAHACVCAGVCGYVGTVCVRVCARRSVWRGHVCVPAGLQTRTFVLVRLPVV